MLISDWSSEVCSADLILRGPVATRFGGSAGNVAINLIDSKVPKALPVGGLSGATEVRFGTGDEEKTLVGRVTAGIGPFAVHAEGSRRRSDDYDVPGAFGSDTLRDSFADSASYSFGASWITSKGYLRSEEHTSEEHTSELQSLMRN